MYGQIHGNHSCTFELHHAQLHHTCTRPRIHRTCFTSHRTACAHAHTTHMPNNAPHHAHHTYTAHHHCRTQHIVNCDNAKTPLHAYSAPRIHHTCHTTQDHTTPENHRAHGDSSSRTRIRRGRTKLTHHEVSHNLAGSGSCVRPVRALSILDGPWKSSQRAHQKRLAMGSFPKGRCQERGSH